MSEFFIVPANRSLASDLCAFEGNARDYYNNGTTHSTDKSSEGGGKYFEKKQQQPPL